MTSAHSFSRVARRSIRARFGRRTALAVVSACAMPSLWHAPSALASINSFNTGTTSSGDWTDSTQWSLGAVPNDPTQQIVLPPGGAATGATTMTFNSGTIVAATISDLGNPGRVLLNTGGSPTTITLNGLAGQPTILDQPTGAFQFSIGTSSVSNNINLVLGAGTNEFRNALVGANVMRIYANISEVNPGTNVTITSTTGNGTLILGGSNSFSGALNLDVGSALLDYNQSNAPLIASTGSLIFNGGTIDFQGANSRTTTQTVAMSSFNAGTTQLIFDANNGGSLSTLNLGTLARSPGGAANIVAAAGPSGGLPSIQTSSANVSGILGGWITVQQSAFTDAPPNNNNYDWATNSGGSIVPFAAYNTIDNEGSWTTNANINNDAPFTGSVGTLTINSLRTNAAGSYTVNTTGLLTIASGGILAQGTFGSGGTATPETLTFSGTGAVTSGTTDLIITGPGSAKTIVFAIPIQDAGGQSVGITKDVGTVVIMGSDTYSGNVYVNTGSLNIDTVANTGQPSSLGTSGTIYLGTVGDAGTLNFGTNGTAVLGGSTDRTFVLGPAGGDIRNTGSGSLAVILTGPISGSSFTRFGTGGTTRILGSKAFAGAVTIGAGSLEVDSIANIGSLSALGTGTIDPSITLGSATAGGATLSYIGTTDAATNRIINLGTMGGTIRVGNLVNLTLNGGLGNLTVGTPSFSLTKFGVGTLIIPGAQSYQGTLSIAVGALSVDTIGTKGTKSGLGTGTMVQGAGTLDVSTITLGGSSSTGTLSYTGTGSASTDRAFVVASSSFNNNGGDIESVNSTLTLNGNIELNKETITFSGAGAVDAAGAIASTGGTGTVVKTGTGTLVLADASNSYAGGTAIDGGYLTIDSDPELGALTGSVTLNGGTLLTANSINSARSFVVGATGGAFDTSTFNSTLTGTITGSGNFTKGGIGVLTTNGIKAGLVVNAGTFAVAQGRNEATKLSDVTNLSVTPGAAIDLNDNDLIYNYSNGGTASTAKLGQVQQLLAGGYAGGSWTGTGITSSVAAANASSTHKTALGYAEASTTGQSTFDGVTTDNDMILVRYTYYGDTNLDGMVNTADFNNLAAHYNQTGANWVEGDFNYDGVVNAEDFALLAANYGATPISAPPALGTLVPEPMSLSALGLCAAMLASRRRRRA